MSLSDIDRVISELNAFRPGSDETDNVCRLNEILSGATEMTGCIAAAPALFDLLERNPTAEFGAIGPIVHTLEAIAPYSKLLAESLKRQPTFYTIQMVGRILNAKLLSFDREFWLSQLKDVVAHPRSTEHDGARALEILERHAT